MARRVVIALGEVLPVSWPIGNAGLRSGFAQASLSITGRGTVSLGPSVSVPVLAGLPEIGSTVPPAAVGLEWLVDVPPGNYQAFTVVSGLDPGSSFTEIEFFPLEVIDPFFF